MEEEKNDERCRMEGDVDLFQVCIPHLFKLHFSKIQLFDASFKFQVKCREESDPLGTHEKVKKKQRDKRFHFVPHAATVNISQTYSFILLHNIRRSLVALG